jgi:hypothetical protein
MLNINFKDYFWGKCDDLHERYYIKRKTISNVIELFTRLNESMANFAKELINIITKDYNLYPETNTSKYEAMEFIKIFLTIQSTQLNVGVEIIKKRILETLKIEKEEEIKERELYTDLKKFIQKYEESKSNLLKAKEKFYQSAETAQMSIFQAKELALKQEDKEKINLNMSNNSNNNSNNDSQDQLVKLEQKYLDNLLEARRNDEKYSEILKETNNYRELANNKQNELLKYYENIENKDHQIYIMIMRDYYSYLKTNNSVIKGNLILMEDKISKIDNNKDIITLINIYGSELKPDKLIKYRPFKPNFTTENADKENELQYQIVMTMKPFIKDLCPNFNIELETKKQEMRELTKKMLSNNDENVAFSDNDKKKLLEYINEEWGQNYFLFFLTKLRTTGHYCRSEKLVKILAEIFDEILNIAEQNVDYNKAKNCIILSQTYYYEDKNKYKKVYLVELICDNKWLRTPDFWRNIIEVMIKEDIKKIKQLMDKQMNKKDENEGIINVVFAQVISYINKMKDFKLENKIIVKIVDEFVEKYNIGKDLSKHIYDNIDKSNEIENLRKQYKNEDENINKNGINY